MTEIKLLNVIRSLEILSNLLQKFEGSSKNKNIFFKCVNNYCYFILANSSIFYCTKFDHIGFCSFDCNNDKFSECQNQAKEKFYIDIQQDGIYYATSSYVFLNKTPDIVIQVKFYAFQ